MIAGVPESTRSRAFRAFVAECQNHPKFANKRVIKTWRLWDGLTPTNPPTVTEMPAAMVRFIGGPVRPIASIRKPGGAAKFDIETQQTLTFEVWVPGSNQYDLVDIGEMISEVYAPEDDHLYKALQTRLGEYGIRSWHLSGEFLPMSFDDYSDKFIHGMGTFQLKMFLSF